MLDLVRGVKVGRRKMRKNFACAVFVGAALFCFSGAANAVTYDLTLTAITGPESGTGFFSLNNTPTTGPQTYTVGGPTNILTALSFTIDGNTFTLADATIPSAPNAVFFNGGLISLDYLGSITNGSVTFALSSGSIFYTYIDFSDRTHNTFGYFGYALDMGATPLPAALPMFAGGLGLVGLLARRKKRKAAIAA
jgi:hypothetical protein